MAREYEFKVRLDIPLESFGAFDATRTLITSWVASKPEGSTYQFNYHETNLEGSQKPLWVEVLMDIVVDDVSDAGTLRSQIETALESLPEGTKPDYVYKEREL